MSFWFHKGDLLVVHPSGQSRKKFKLPARMILVEASDEGRGGQDAGWDVYDGIRVDIERKKEVSFHGFDVIRKAVKLGPSQWLKTNRDPRSRDPVRWSALQRQRAWIEAEEAWIRYVDALRDHPDWRLPYFEDKREFMEKRLGLEPGTLARMPGGREKPPEQVPVPKYSGWRLSEQGKPVRASRHMVESSSRESRVWSSRRDPSVKTSSTRKQSSKKGHRGAFQDHDSLQPEYLSTGICSGDLSRPPGIRTSVPSSSSSESRVWSSRRDRTRSKRRRTS